MKTIISLFMFLGILTASVFAEQFSKTKFNQIVKAGKWSQVRKYCYNASISNESNYEHAYYKMQYMIDDSKLKLTKEQIEKECNDFSKYLTEKEKNKLLLHAYGVCGFQTEAKQYAMKSKAAVVAYEKLLIYAVETKNKQLIWKYTKQLLINNGQGYNNPTKSTKYLNNAFRFKPITITKEQQVAFIEQLAQIYPIPGTQFNTWKPFMGFIGYKYKALTGKDLFPETK